MQRILTLKLSQATIRDTAMKASGIDPKLMALKPGTRRFVDRKARLQRGHVKHRSRAFD